MSEGQSTLAGCQRKNKRCVWCEIGKRIKRREELAKTSPTLSHKPRKIGPPEDVAADSIIGVSVRGLPPTLEGEEEIVSNAQPESAQ